MAELLVHLIIVLVGGILVGLAFKDMIYAVAFGIGGIISDVIDIGLNGIQKIYLNPKDIMDTPGSGHLAIFGNSAVTWIIISLISIGIISLVYKFDKMKRETFLRWALIITLFIIAVVIHLILDVLIS
jgi:hypothetical protein